MGTRQWANVFRRKFEDTKRVIRNRTSKDR